MIESIPFILSLVSVWAYGKKGLSGPIIGCICAISFIAFGFHADIKAAALANLFFLWLHFNNGRKIMQNTDQNQIRKIKQQWDAITENSIVGGSARQFLINECHGASKAAGWWSNLETAEDYTATGNFSVGEKLCLIHSEISEAMEGHRKNLQDDKLPHRKMIEVELADVAIRVFDLVGALGGKLEETLKLYHASDYNHLEDLDAPSLLTALHGEVSNAWLMHLHDGSSSDVVQSLELLLCTLVYVSNTLKLDIGGAMGEKLLFNKTRPDHKLENRKKGGGKAY